MLTFLIDKMTEIGIEGVLILDFGSQYTQLIVRRIREIGVFSTLLPGDVTLDRIRAQNPVAIILSGGPRSVTDATTLPLPNGFFAYCREFRIPVLGICYGLQVIVASLNGVVEKAENGGEYGRTVINVDPKSVLFSGLVKPLFLSILILQNKEKSRSNKRFGCRMETL